MTAKPLAQIDLTGATLGGAPVLGALSLVVGPQETVALRGPSGVGKTTLLRILAGLESGFDGRRVVSVNTAIMFQEPTLLPWRRALDNITITTGCSETTAQELMREVGLPYKAQAYPGQLSLGQQRRLALARALAMAPDLLLLDEPFVSLDSDLVDDMLTLFARLRDRRRLATIIVTHSDREAEAIATRIVTLGGSPARIVAERANTPRL